MQEKLKNMSPEELKAFQKQQCIFCQIISGKVASKKVYSDDKCSGLLDINPANPGHILLLPNEHYSIMPLMPDDELGHMFMVAKALCQVSLKALEAQGTNIFVANGAAAGQKAQHFMLHVIPRKEGDGVNINIPEKAIKDSDMKQIMDRLKPAIIKALGPGTTEEETPKDEEAEKPVEEKQEEEPKQEVKEKPKKPIQKGNGKFVTSEKARRFHSSNCSFAEKIPEDDRIFLDEDEAKDQGKLACGCTKLKKKKPEIKENKPKKQPKEPEEEPQEKNKEGVTLDDISDMLTGI